MIRRHFLHGLAASTLLALSGCGFRYRSDAEMLAWLHQNEREFIRLVKMALEETAIEQVAPDFCRDIAGHAHSYPASPDGFSRERWESYRDLFKALRLEGGIFTQGPHSQWIPNSVMMTAEASGLAMSGSSKGYIWSQNVLEPLLERLDPLFLPTGGDSWDYMAYRRIKPEWYLYYEAT